MAQQDLYAILGIQKSATQAEIKKAFKRTAMKYHPDRNADDASAQEKFKEAQMAYEILKDEQKRQTYDQYGFDAVSGQSAGPGGFGGGFQGDVGDIFGDIFSDIFGGGGRRGRNPGPQRGRDVQIELSVELEEAIHGVNKEINKLMKV